MRGRGTRARCRGGRPRNGELRACPGRPPRRLVFPPHGCTSSGLRRAAERHRRGRPGDPARLRPRPRPRPGVPLGRELLPPAGQPGGGRARLHPPVQPVHRGPDAADGRAPAALHARAGRSVRARRDELRRPSRGVLPARHRDRRRRRLSRAPRGGRACRAAGGGYRGGLPTAVGGRRLAHERVAVRPDDRVDADLRLPRARPAERRARGAAGRRRRTGRAHPGRGPAAGPAAGRSRDLARGSASGRRRAGGVRARPGSVVGAQPRRLRPARAALQQHRQPAGRGQLPRHVRRPPARRMVGGLPELPAPRERGADRGSAAAAGDRLHPGPDRALSRGRRGTRAANVGLLPARASRSSCRGRRPAIPASSGSE